MSIGIIWLLVIVILPIGLLYLLKSNAAMVYLSLCLGYVLYAFDYRSTKSLGSNGTIGTIHFKTSTMIVDLVLLLGPAVFTLISQIKSTPGKKRILNFIPAVFVGLFTPLLIVPVLPKSIMLSIYKLTLWIKLSHYQALIVGVGAAVALVFLVINKKEHHKNHHKVSE